jgi:hypothetical protein
VIRRAAAVLLTCVAVVACSDGGHRATQSPASTAPAAPGGGDVGSSGDRARVPDRIDTPGVTSPTGAVVQPSASIRSDCSVDVASELQAWLDAVPDGSRMRLPRRACYRIESTLRVRDRRDLLIDGNGSELHATTRGEGARIIVRGRSQLQITNSSNVTVRDLVVRGANPHGGTSAEAYQPDLEAQHAFSLSGDDGVLLDHVAASDTYGDFVYVGGSGRQPSRDITVARSTFARSGRQGISVTGADGVTIVGNQIRDVARSLFDLEPNLRSQSVRNVRIEANTTGAARNFWLANKGSGIDIGDIVVVDNVMQEPTGGLVFVYGPDWGKRGPYAFTDNRMRVTGAVTDENATGAFFFRNARDVAIRDNDVQLQRARSITGVELQRVDGAAITGNQFRGASKPVDADAASRDVRVTSP